MLQIISSRARGRNFLFGTVSAGILALHCLSASAQEPPVDTPTEDQTLRYGVVTVTSQKREQSISDIAGSVSVTDGEFLDDLNISDSKDLIDFVPGLTIKATAAGNANATIRGLGTAPGSSSFDQSVAFFQDGIYAGRSTQFDSGFLDVERIEVIKGPQSTLLGKNASLGAISIISKAPTTEFEDRQHDARSRQPQCPRTACHAGWQLRRPALLSV